MLAGQGVKEITAERANLTIWGGTRETRDIYVRPERKRPTVLGSTTCTGMSLNGVKTYSTPSITNFLKQVE